MSSVVPPSAGLVTSNVPPTASMRSRSPVSPDPRVGSAPPMRAGGHQLARLSALAIAVARRRP
jgi:hypothetical protein